MDTRLGPLHDLHQRWEGFELRVTPRASVRRYLDGFGNVAHLVTLAAPHQYVEVVMRAEVVTLLADPFVPLDVPAPPLTPGEAADWLPPSPLVPVHAELERLATPFRPATPAATLEAVRGLMKLVYDGFSYQQHVTSVATTVDEVLACRTGVCQDFAHVLIGLCRVLAIPARYVSGYIVGGGSARRSGRAGQWQSQSQSQGGGDEPRRGAGASHAWIEAYTPTHGWRGFDPTNNLLASEHHVKMAVGRDYSDVPPTRGTFRGTAEERLCVDVATERRTECRHPVVPFAQDAGIGIMVWSPLAGGFLSGKYTRENPGGSGGRLTGFNIIPFDRERGYDVVERLREIAAAHGASPAQVAIAWLLQRPAVTSVLVGASRPDQLDDNLGAAALRLRGDELAAFDELTVPALIYPNWYNATIHDDPVRNVLER